MEPVRLIVYSDYLCPWCYNATVRMERLEESLGERVQVEWRSFLLRPRPEPGRDLERFRAYTRSWRAVGEQEDSGEFRPWRGEAGPPSHSVPPQRVAKAAAELGPDAFRRLHRALLRAYFGESRDVTDAVTLRAIWREEGLPEAAFARSEDPAVLRRILAEHQEAVDAGATGVPAVRLADGDACLVGALPVALYRRWVERTLAGRE